MCHPDIRKTPKTLWTRRHLKFSKKYARYRLPKHCRKDRLPLARPLSTEFTDDSLPTEVVDVECRLEATAQDEHRRSLTTSPPPGRCHSKSSTPKICDEDLSKTCSSGFDEVVAVKRGPSIWRPVDDDRSDQTESTVADKNAQIFSRSEDEVLYSPKFFGDRWTPSESADRCLADTSTYSDRHFQLIACPEEPTTTSAIMTKLPSPILPHFKKRLLLNTTAGSKSTPCRGGDHRAVEPLVIGRTPGASGSFVIHEDKPLMTSTSTSAVSSTSSALSTLNCLQAGNALAPAKIGIVISHGRAMTLQDKLQSMNTSSPVMSPSTTATQTSSVQLPGPDADIGGPVFHRKQAVGHRSSDKRRKNARHKLAKRSLPVSDDKDIFNSFAF